MPSTDAPWMNPETFDAAGELELLRILIEETNRSVIAFGLFQYVADREAAVQYLKEHLALPFAERRLSAERKNPIRLLDDLPDARHCVNIYDLEAALPDVTGHVNIGREAYATIPHALIFWVGPHGLQQIARKAPDFWAWRSGVFDVRTDGSRADALTQSVSQSALSTDIRYTDRGDLERRASLYAGLIREWEAEDDPDAAYVARLRSKLMYVLYLLRDFDGAEREARRVMAWAEPNDPHASANAYHLLGMVAEEHREFAEAERWYRKSLEIWESHEDEHRAAITYHQLGRIAQQRREFAEAERWYRKSLEITESKGDEHRAARTYHQLGMIAEERREFAEAERWYRKSLDVAESRGDEHGAAITYHQLGRIAEQRRNFSEAERWYRKSLEIEESQGNEHGAAITYHQLGGVAQERGDFEEAERWYRKSLEVKESRGNEHGAAITYHQLGRIAQERRNFSEAERWYRKSLEIEESQGNKHGAAITYWALGDVAVEREAFSEAVTHWARAARTFARTNDPNRARATASAFVAFLDAVPEADRADLQQRWLDAGLPPVWEDDVSVDALPRLADPSDASETS